MRARLTHRLHLGHENTLKYDARPFENIDQMNAELVRRWNSVIKKNDTVYVLGDVYYKMKSEDAGKLLSELKGKKILIKGNHDKISPAIASHFNSIVDYLEIKDNGRDVVLFHYPIAAYNGYFNGAYHLYGHVHYLTDDAKLVLELLKKIQSTYGRENRAFNVGACVPGMDYTPKTLDQIIEANR
jgi:calcineurin-like phosphoesterase family protein